MQHFVDYIFQLAETNQFFQGGIVLAAISWAFYQLKSWPVFVWNKFKYFATYEVYFDDVVGGDFYVQFTEWLNERYPQKFRNVEVRLWWDDGGGASYSNSQPQPVASLGSLSNGEPKWTLRRFQFNDSNVIFYNRRLLWVRKNRKEREHAQNFAFINDYSISGFFARQAIDALCEEILNRKISATKKNSLRVMINTESGYFEGKDVEIVKSLDHVFFAQKAELVRDLDNFLERKEFYRRKGINFKRNYLFYGPPGTGKTTLASAIAKHLDYTLCVVNLASVKDDLQLQRLAASVQRKTVVLLEDIDCVLSDRDVKTDNLNFSTILNFLDGLYAPSDCVFALTTNHPEVLDDALLRKGRVDLSLHVDFPGISEVEQFMSDFYEIDVRLPILIGHANKGMAEVQDICLRNNLETAKLLAQNLFMHTNGHKAATVTV